MGYFGYYIRNIMPNGGYTNTLVCYTIAKAYALMGSIITNE